MTFEKLKNDSLNLLKKETKRFRRKENLEIAEVESLLNTLHLQLASKARITPADAIKRSELQARLLKHKNTLNPPKARSSNFRYRSGEMID